MKNKKGRFITIEGGEGVGKTLFLSRFIPKLEALGISVLSTREPGGTPVAESLRKLFSNPPPGEPLMIETELFVISAARAQHVSQKIKPALSKGTWVICDRFVDSTRVYQGKLGGFPSKLLEHILQTSTYFIEPDLTLLLDCDVSLALSRVRNRSKQPATNSKNSPECPTTSEDGASRYDSANLSFHENLRQAYLELVRRFPSRIVKIDTSDAIDDVVDSSLAIVRRKFNV